VLCLQSISNTDSSDKNASGNFKISKHAFEFYKQKICPFESDLFNIFEVDSLNALDLRQILIDLAKDYQRSINYDINLAIQIIDKKNQTKSYTTQTEVRKELMNYHQVNDIFIEVEKDLVYAVIEKCGGNPSQCL
jgi:hypothetical protein